MRFIRLSKGLTAEVDDEDYDFLVKIGSWYAGDNYPQIVDKKVKPNKTILMHRVVWNRHFGEIPEHLMIDHENGNGYDVRKTNLRLVTRQQNAINSASRSHNRSGYKGVHLDKRYGKYQAMIRINGILEHIGMFGSAEDAAYAFNLCASIVHGEYARLNDALPSLEAVQTIEDNSRLMSILHPMDGSRFVLKKPHEYTNL